MTVRQMLLCVLTLLILAHQPLAAGPAAIAGSWLGSIDTDRGQMQIGLEVTNADGKLTGTLRTAHGDWEVTGITEKEGVWTVAFRSDGGRGTMTGRIKDGHFSGEWNNQPQAVGTFDLAAAKKKK